jgi:hypothetical protein
MRAGVAGMVCLTAVTDTSLRTRKGWDDVTGVGTPTAIYIRYIRRRSRNS